jgi:hypothetical protein
MKPPLPDGPTYTGRRQLNVSGGFDTPVPLAGGKNGGRGGLADEELGSKGGLGSDAGGL